MGQEVEHSEFTAEDFQAFDACLADDLVALGRVLDRPGFGEGPLSIGAELEFALVDGEGNAAPLNTDLLASLDSARWAPELNRFGIEYCTDPMGLEGNPFAALHADLQRAVSELNEAAKRLGSRAVAIGTLPTLRPEDIGPSAISTSPRFRALDAGLAEAKPTDLLMIDGPEPLSITLEGISAEGANAALQLHLRVPPEDFARTFNAAQMATAPALAASANSPTFLGHVLWEETRVPLFHKAVDGHDGSEAPWRSYRVAFGHGWVRDGAYELFQEYVALHPPLLPVCAEENDLEAVERGEAPELSELRLHAGTTWRWNRPVYDPIDGGHLRIEFRALPSGPTVTDMVANAAFLLGLTLALRDEPWMTVALPFGGARRNFFQAALKGLDATLAWPTETPPSPAHVPVTELFDGLLPLAMRGLHDAGVDAPEAMEILEPIRRRVARNVTGSSWQRDQLAALRQNMSRPDALRAMLEKYQECVDSGEPLHAWPRPS